MVAVAAHFVLLERFRLAAQPEESSGVGHRHDHWFIYAFRDIGIFTEMVRRAPEETSW